MSRTDDLRQGGAEERTGGGGGGGAPFVKWSDAIAWVEGRLQGLWQTKFGDAALITVAACSDRLPTKGKSEDGTVTEGVAVTGGDVNVGMNSSALENRLTSSDIGDTVHIAFDGWQEPKNVGGNRYRLFTVLVLAERAGVTAGGDDQPDSVIDSQAGGYEEPEDDIPF